MPKRCFIVFMLLDPDSNRYIYILWIYSTNGYWLSIWNIFLKRTHLRFVHRLTERAKKLYHRNLLNHAKIFHGCYQLVYLISSFPKIIRECFQSFNFDMKHAILSFDVLSTFIWDNIMYYATGGHISLVWRYSPPSLSLNLTKMCRKIQQWGKLG